VPGATSTVVFGINDHSQLVGQYFDLVRGHGFLLSGGAYTTLDVPGATFTGLYGINNAGQIVGYYVDGNRAHGFLFSAGSYTTIDVPGATFTDITGINDAGQIVGYYGDANGNQHGFLATPVPEPSTLLLLAISTLGLVGWAWWRRGRTA
jgi:probable HAF family extracellular repeat protein